MATFYVLPSRHLVGQRFGDFLGSMFPGLRWPKADHPELAEAMSMAALGYPDTFVVFREDIAEEDIEASLLRDFGANAGDWVVEVHIGTRFADVWHQRWSVGERVQRRAA